MKSFQNITTSVLFLSMVFLCSCQIKDKKNVFKQDLALPEFTLISAPDSTIVKSSALDTEGIVLVKYFSPDCDHCKTEARTYLSKVEQFDKVKTLWISGDWASLKDIEDFTYSYGLYRTKPIGIGKDDKSSLVLYYNIDGVPYSAVYKDNQFIKEYRNGINYAELKEINEGTYIPQPQDSLLKVVQSFGSTSPQ